MISLALRQIRYRGGRAVAIVAALFIASTGFILLTTASTTSRLATIGTVEANARTAYDILVRPSHTQSALEGRQEMVEPGFLSSIHGGISQAQWRAIQQLPGVQVAAPIAVLGYALPVVRYPVDVTGVLPAGQPGLARVDVTWRTDSGLTSITGPPSFAYVTPNPLLVAAEPNSRSAPPPYLYIERSAEGERHLCGVDSTATPTLLTRAPASIECFSEHGGGSQLAYRWPQGLIGQQVAFRIPYIVAAVDPVSEDQLTALSSALTSGSGLIGASLDYPLSMTGQAVPVLASSRAPVDVQATVHVSVVGSSGVSAAQQGVTGDQLTAYPTAPPATQFTVNVQQAYEKLLDQFRQPPNVCSGCHIDNNLPGNILALQQVGPIDLDENGSSAFAHPVNADTVWPWWKGAVTAPAGNEDLQVRSQQSSRKDPYSEHGDPRATPLVLRGVYDETRLQGLADLTDQILSGYSTVPTEGADDYSSAVLGGKPLAASSNLGGLVQAPPSMITTLDALPQLTGEPWEPTNAAAPISAVRVKVAEVAGVDDASRERVRLAAQRISEATGLDVDVTVGSSVTQRTITLPSGLFGRPELTLSQPWVKKGVAIAIITAVDRKSVGLFCLVLLVSGFTVANSAMAAARGRRAEVGVLAAVGWTRRSILAMVLAELIVLALGAGALATAVAMIVGEATGLPVTWARALLAIPVCLATAVLAGLVPASQAARSTPMDALQAATSEDRSPRRAQGISSLAWTNLMRSRTRTVLGSTGYGVAVLVFSALLAITVAFQGAVVGTVLGDAIALQARPADYAAAAATLGLALLGIANVLYLNIRDRAKEIATLRAVGWTERDLARLVGWEGTIMALLGAVPGAIVGACTIAVLAGTATLSWLATSVFAASFATAVAWLTAAISAQHIRRLNTATLLSE